MLKKFVSYYKPNMKLFTLDIVCAFLIAAIDLIFPVMIRETLNNLIPNGRINILYIFAGVLIVLYILKAVFNYIVDYWGHVVGTRMQHDMRRDLFIHLQTLPFKYFDNNKTGNLMSRVVNDLFEISELAHHGPEDLFLSFVMLVGSFAVLMTIDWRLTLIVFSFIPILLLYGILRRKTMAKSFKEVKQKTANVNSQLENSLAGIRIAKSFTNEDYEIEKFNNGNKEFRTANEYVFKSMAQMTTGINFISNLINVVMIVVGGVFVYKKVIAVGDLLAYFLYINYFFQPIQRIIHFTQQYEAGMAGFERFMEVINTKPDIVDKKCAAEMNNVKGNIEFCNISFSYNDNKSVLDNINLKIEKGQTLALVGPSGGGKTTLCHLIPRFYDVLEGEILIDGLDIRDVTIKSLRKNIGLVSQEVFLFTGTIGENILYGNPGATHEEVIKAAKMAEIHDFIMSLPEGYETYVGEKGVMLSGGQKQRVSIARVFLKNPPILILDEATSALDNETEIKIQKALEALSHGRTTIVIAHRLSTIRYSDKIVVLGNMGIEEIGKHEELVKTNGPYAKLYNVQNRESSEMISA